MDKFRLYLKRFVLIAVVYAFNMIVFFLFRFFYTINIIPSIERNEFSNDIFQSFITGLRFDTVTICYGLLLPVLMSFSGLIITNVSWQSFIDSFNKKFLIICSTFFVLLLVIDYFYYNYFQAHFNIMILGFWEDDTGAILKSVYTDYPLFRVLLFMTSFYLLIRWFVRRAGRNIASLFESTSFFKLSMTSLLLTGLFTMGLRGSFGTFPVQIDDANISSNPKVNLLSVNGVFALKNVLGYAFMQSKLGEFDKEIKNIGMLDKERAFKTYFGNNIDCTKRDFLFTETPVNPVAEKDPPHVILFLMESMSNNNLYLQSKEINVMGALEKYFREGIVFRNFLPAQNGTINTLEALMVNTPITSIAQSRYGSNTFPSSTAKPFLESGYATNFISGGKLNWRNINTFIPRQYFQNIEGDGDIKAANPSTQECEWGVYDEYLFDHVFHKLEKATKPLFIFALSTTNHTPFHLPDHYKPLPVSLNDSIRNILKVEEERALKNLTNFQYSNDCLGQFLDKLKASPYGSNTIVFATGDHNNLMLFDFTPGQLFYKLSVPLVMYIPEKYMGNSKVDTSRWGSHKDIFPTLYNLALSKTKYFNAGNDLLSSRADPESFYGMDVMSYTAMDNRGAVRFDRNPANYKWTNNNNLSPIRTDTTASLMIKSRSYFATFYHYIKEIGDK